MLAVMDPLLDRLVYQEGVRMKVGPVGRQGLSMRLARRLHLERKYPVLVRG